MKFNPFGEHVILSPINSARMSGSILIPEGVNRDYRLGVVLAIGDGRVRVPSGADHQANIYVSPGDLVFFKVPSQQSRTCTYNIDLGGEEKPHVDIDLSNEGRITVMSMHQRDILGRLANGAPQVTLDNFEPVGEWALIKHFTNSHGLIIMPDSVSPVEDIRFKAIRVGLRAAELGVSPEQELIVERRRCETVFFEHGGETTERFLISAYHVHATLEMDENGVPAVPAVADDTAA
jgi:co-chaperonin GroES (HSP10)